MEALEILESKKNIESNNEEIKRYRKLFDNKLIMKINIKKNNEEINIDKKNIDMIFKKLNDNFEKNISYVIFSVIKKYDLNKEYNNKIYLDSLIKTSNPLNFPFEMKDSDFNNI